MPNTTPRPPERACQAEPGAFRPQVDLGRCEGKAACEAVCPYDVFVVRKLEAADRTGLSWLSKIKIAVHGGKVAYVDNGEACRACGLCVTACPEDAITLVGA